MTNYEKDSEGVFRSGFVTLVGRPNAGKSSLINALLGRKVAITSSTAQTTRRPFRALLNGPSYQIVFVDTPGFHKPHDMLGEELNLAASKSLEDIEVVIMLIDSSKDIGRGDEWVAAQLKPLDVPKLCVLSKIDLVDDATLQAAKEKARELLNWDGIIAVSAKESTNLEEFRDAVLRFLPEGPAWFPQDMTTDQPLEILIAEFIREKILRGFRDEVPHAVGVVVQDLEDDEDKDLTRIFATIYVERESQKGIVIGKGGQALKTIGIQARKDLELLLGT